MVKLLELGLKLGIWTQEASRSRYRPEGTTLCAGFLPIRFGSYFLPVFFCYLFLVSLFRVRPSTKDLTRCWAGSPVNFKFYNSTSSNRGSSSMGSSKSRSRKSGSFDPSRLL